MLTGFYRKMVHKYMAQIKEIKQMRTYQNMKLQDLNLTAKFQPSDQKVIFSDIYIYILKDLYISW